MLSFNYTFVYELKNNVMLYIFSFLSVGSFSDCERFVNVMDLGMLLFELLLLMLLHSLFKIYAAIWYHLLICLAFVFC